MERDQGEFHRGALPPLGGSEGLVEGEIVVSTGGGGLLRQRNLYQHCPPRGAGGQPPEWEGLMEVAAASLLSRVCRVCPCLCPCLSAEQRECDGDSDSGHGDGGCVLVVMVEVCW